ncbi:Lrp/AsnC family transcriptional regulator [Acinetobacter rudis]|uniref:Lrp/AsnC family transcriptional regulator n=1 Tax=Acinetobacter rudis TaxID=632955 RepID=A0AAW8J6X3_9GAMM|nr:Lrp/AsnC family transcriptional regulator [Acinetobacter rudis]MDQ8935495.1 Lrp/AsnC family transcriptional regulator [Acinetobacter rudis]MDQ8953569.1 Lrp/AsnC family transcriptional regulator [Acinetobacter rudis]MDQ9017738.1 Lrp/AsnC family transcriptional regulator [Acinetobacter rudis]
MNNTDNKILGLLRANARMTITELANTLRISRATVQKRIELLETQGIITGYTIKIRPQIEKKLIRAWVSIRVEGNKTHQVIKTLRLESTVNTIHSTNGKWDLLVELHCEDLESFDQSLDRIRTITGVSFSETSILLTTYKN